MKKIICVLAMLTSVLAYAEGEWCKSRSGTPAKIEHLSNGDLNGHLLVYAVVEGESAFRQLRTNNSDLKILLNTAYNTDSAICLLESHGESGGFTFIQRMMIGKN